LGEDKVRQTMRDFDILKNLTLDGINFGFIKDFQVKLKSDVMRFLTEFDRNSKLSRDLNCTLIVLIPKVESPQWLNGFRRISQVGCMYKSLAKELANWLRLVILKHHIRGSVRVLIADEVVDNARKNDKE
jgi:hypothetical protein